ncbi:hypothetical protein CCP3SC1_570007 [Gammaproteobacteria bacterium]
MTTQKKPLRLIIQGITNQGQLFHPNNWAERLCGYLANLGNGRRPHYSPYVYIRFLPGEKSLVVESGLWETNPKNYELLLSFARENDLKMTEENEEVWEQLIPGPAKSEFGGSNQHPSPSGLMIGI